MGLFTKTKVRTGTRPENELTGKLLAQLSTNVFLFENRVEYQNSSGGYHFMDFAKSAVTAEVESLGNIVSTQRVTGTRLLAGGIFALAVPKKTTTDDRSMVLHVEHRWDLVHTHDPSEAVHVDQRGDVEGICCSGERPISQAPGGRGTSGEPLAGVSLRQAADAGSAS